MICPAYLTEGLHQVFNRIQRERMQGLPLLNPVLRVECVGFRPWQGHCLGVLITPWFMNLMLLPGEGDAWEGLSVGEKVIHRFPSGPYELIVGDEEGIGRYQLCPLFSPMFEFASQEMAVAVAEEIMKGLLDEENRDRTSMREQEIARIWSGESEGEEREETESADPTPLMERPISRRKLLSGGFSRGP